MPNKVSLTRAFTSDRKARIDRDEDGLHWLFQILSPG